MASTLKLEIVTPETMNYSGLVQNNSLSVRASNILQCGGEGPYRFEFILTGSKRS